MSIDDFFSHLNDNTFSFSVDTEYEGGHTLTIQTAADVGKQLVTQIYHCPTISPPPIKDVSRMVSQQFGWGIGSPILREAKSITPELSPLRMVLDLLGIPEGGFHLVARHDIACVLAKMGHKDCDISTIPQGQWTKALKEKVQKPIVLRVVGHFLRADLLRMLGIEFAKKTLIPSGSGTGRLTVSEQGSPKFTNNTKGKYQNNRPVMEYLIVGGLIYPIQVECFDIYKASGTQGSLDHLAKTYLGLKKSLSVPKEDKSRMVLTFKEKPVEAFAYAISDSILTLKVWRKMAELDQQLYCGLGYSEDEIPGLGGTMGRRVCNLLTSFILKMFNQQKENGSQSTYQLTKEQITKLMKFAGGDFLTREYKSRFGGQIGKIHGGLISNRSSLTFSHESNGNFRDVDLVSFYQSILQNQTLYLGQPLPLEKGAEPMTLKEGIEYLNLHAVGRDGWIVKVSGTLKNSINGLIPSTQNALTNSNYREKRDQARAQGLSIEDLNQDGEDWENSVLFSETIESGVVNWATWDVIQTFPESQRLEYENLQVDSLFFYPKHLVAHTPEQYNKMYEKYRNNGTPFSDTIDFANGFIVKRDIIDQDHVSIAVPLKDLMKKLGQERKKAKETSGPKAALANEFKLYANSVYGVLSSEYFPTHNVVAANGITATARAMAFLIHMTLNGFQMITDGCVYRKDQIPSVTLRECLDFARDYPIRRPGVPVAYLNPCKVPLENEAFTRWFRKRVNSFFEDSNGKLDNLLSIFSLEHKSTNDQGNLEFDGLICHGSSNYLLLRKEGGQWVCDKFKARGIPEEEKAKLIQPLIRIFTTDRFDAPLPLIESHSLLSWEQASKEARDYFSRHQPGKGRSSELCVQFPMGFSQKRELVYRLIRLSGFIFPNPEKRKIFQKNLEKAIKIHNLGLDFLALKPSESNGQGGRISDLAKRLADWIDSDVKYFNGFNIRRAPSREVRHALKALQNSLKERKTQSAQALQAQMSVPKQNLWIPVSGLWLTKEDGERMKLSSSFSR